MTDTFVSSDVGLLDLLRKRDSMTVAELADALDVTATAVRQRLNRLLAQGHVARTATKSGRGRPSHHYELTSQGRRKTGANFADLSIALWQEIRAISDPDVRRGLLERIARRLAEQYADEMAGDTLQDKMARLADLFAERNVPFSLDGTADLPVLTALACPYPELAEHDRSVCAMERMMFTELLGEQVRLTSCRLDGERCCTFEPSRDN